MDLFKTVIQALIIAGIQLAVFAFILSYACGISFDPFGNGFYWIAGAFVLGASIGFWSMIMIVKGAGGGPVVSSVSKAVTSAAGIRVTSTRKARAGKKRKKAVNDNRKPRSAECFPRRKAGSG